MIRALALLLVALPAAGSAQTAPASPSSPPSAAPREEGRPPPEVVPLRTADDVARLCTAILPVERLRTKGDAVERGEADVRHESARDEALARRYEVVVPAERLGFAPFDVHEGRLELSDRADLLAAGGAARVVAPEERGLPVEVDAATARRIVAAAKARRLSLAVVFEIPEDATCFKLVGAKRWTVPMDPAAWTYRDGGAVLARGGEGSDLPLVTAADGARPRVEVGKPLSGDAGARAVGARTRDLAVCYGQALVRNPGADGVLVARVGEAKPSIAADSVGDPELRACVERALTGVTVAAAAAVPIRFVLDAPPAAR